MGLRILNVSSSVDDKPFSRSIMARSSSSVADPGSSGGPGELRRPVPATRRALDGAVVGNPDPRNYQVLRRTRIAGFLILEVRYPQATNYEGRKILMYDRGVTEAQITEQGHMDPHFCDVGVHPIARFEPTERGWEMAQHLAACTV